MAVRTGRGSVKPDHQVITAILTAATGGGARPALATAALESCATLYASALSACAVSGPSSITRALTADWRASVASALIRTGQALYIIGADPVDGLHLAPVSHWDVHGGPRPSSWYYRCERAGVSPLQRAADTGSLSEWIEKLLSEEASSPVGSFLPVAKYDTSGADLDADDPLALLRRDIGTARGQILAVESQMAAADSPASAPRKDYQVARFGANPPEGLVELRTRVCVDIGAACGVPKGLLDGSTSGQAARESWRQFVSTSVDGLARRLEAQLCAQLGVEVAIDTATLGGRDVPARAAAFRRLAGKEGGLTIDDARAAPMSTQTRVRKAMGEHAKDWPDSKVEEFQRRADILTDIVIEMYQAGRAAGPLAEARAVVPDDIGDELEERSAIQEYDAHLPRGTAERMAVSDHVRRQRR